MANPKEAATQQNDPDAPKRPLTPQAPQGAGDSVWDRIKRHKVVEWSLAYIAFGYATLHGSQMLRETFEWPLVVPRLTFFVLLIGLPFAVTLAWYHGHRAQHRVSRGEISILVALLVIAGTVLWVVSRSTHDHDTGSSRPASTSAARLSEVSATAGESIKALAVLPFVDLSQDHDQEYLADGMAEEILDLLTRIPQLAVLVLPIQGQERGSAHCRKEARCRVHRRRQCPHFRVARQGDRAADRNAIWNARLVGKLRPGFP
jgi:TolB-like protein